jgi:prevent-host-death family protein
MRSLTLTAFRQSASQVLDLVEEGEAIRLIRHGKAIAVIVPIGRWLGSDGAQPSWKSKGLRLKLEGPSLSEAILEERRQRP